MSTDKKLADMKREVKHFAGLAMMGMMIAETQKPKTAGFRDIAEASAMMGLHMVEQLNSKPFNTELAKRLLEL